jgi:hypothetical protein
MAAQVVRTGVGRERGTMHHLVPKLGVLLGSRRQRMRRELTSYPGRVGTDRWRSLSELNAEAPDHHHDSTVENLEGLFGASEALRCFHKEYVAVFDINEALLHDDPDDVEGVAKIESIRLTIRVGVPLPAIVLVHTPTGQSARASSPVKGKGFYHLLEGLHRYNAARRERAPQVYAWVAHVGCCGGPAADVVDEWS